LGDVERSLSTHGIDDIFNNRGESSPFCSVMQMTQAEVLFLPCCTECNPIIVVQDKRPTKSIDTSSMSLVYATGQAIYRFLEKVPVGFTVIAFIGIYFIEFLIGMQAVDCAVGQIRGIMVRCRGHDGS